MNILEILLIILSTLIFIPPVLFFSQMNKEIIKKKNMIGIIPQPEENTTEEKVLLVQSYEYLGLKEENSQKDFNQKIIEKTKEKVDKETDKGLSTNDYNDNDKNRVEALNSIFNEKNELILNEEKIQLSQSYVDLELTAEHSQKHFNEKVVEKIKKLTPKEKDAGGTDGFSEQNLKFEPLNETTADVENNIAKLKNTAFFKKYYIPENPVYSIIDTSNLPVGAIIEIYNLSERETIEVSGTKIIGDRPKVGKKGSKISIKKLTNEVFIENFEKDILFDNNIPSETLTEKEFNTQYNDPVIPHFEDKYCLKLPITGIEGDTLSFNLGEKLLTGNFSYIHSDSKITLEAVVLSWSGNYEDPKNERYIFNKEIAYKPALGHSQNFENIGIKEFKIPFEISKHFTLYVFFIFKISFIGEMGEYSPEGGYPENHNYEYSFIPPVVSVSDTPIKNYNI